MKKTYFILTSKFQDINWKLSNFLKFFFFSFSFKSNISIFFCESSYGIQLQVQKEKKSQIQPPGEPIEQHLLGEARHQYSGLVMTGEVAKKFKLNNSAIKKAIIIMFSVNFPLVFIFKWHFEFIYKEPITSRPSRTSSRWSSTRKV